MKIGKLFAKIADLSRKKDALYQKVYKHLADINYKSSNGEPVRTPNQKTLKMIKAALVKKNMRILKELTSNCTHTS